jgi:cell division protein FtsB
MNRTWPILTGFYAAFMVYSILILVWGPKGQLQYSMLEEHKHTLMENVKKLEKYQNDLGNQAKKLATDKNAVLLEARTLGYYEADEGRIVLAEAYKPQGKGYTLGTFIRPYKSEAVDTSLLKIVALCAGFLTTILCWNMFDRKNDRIRAARKN